MQPNGWNETMNNNTKRYETQSIRSYNHRIIRNWKKQYQMKFAV